MDDEELESAIVMEVSRSIKKVCGHIETLAKRDDIKENFPPTIKRAKLDGPLLDMIRSAYRKALIQMAKVESKYISASERTLGHG